MWDPATETFTLMAAQQKVARTYHSVGVLLPDGRVFTGGGGLCGDRCTVNHLDVEIFNPPYLFTATGQLAPRPNITLSAAAAPVGSSITVTGSEQLMMISMIRMGTNTHSTNTDQRRIELCGPFTWACSTGPVTVSIPADPGIALPGYWMVFGINALGTPSVASILLVSM
jgi:galactose oxidase